MKELANHHRGVSRMDAGKADADASGRPRRDFAGERTTFLLICQGSLEGTENVRNGAWCDGSAKAILAG
jgi:hypothetical protein